MTAETTQLLYREEWVGRALDAAEEALRLNLPDRFCTELQTLPTELFLMLYFDRPERWPAISGWLPPLPSETDQSLWTGSAGFKTLHLASGFIDDLFAKLARCVSAPKVLDYGCGWGRMLRVLYNRVPLSNIYGVDPWPASIECMNACNVHGAIAQVDYEPKKLPFSEKFDLIFAYSVFTHIGQNSQRAILSTLRRHIQDDGLLALTVRPPTFWQNEPWPDHETRKKLIEEHFDRGFAFAPLDGPHSDYGATSISLDYIAREWRDWRVDGTQWRLTEPYQLTVFLRPA